MWDFFYEGVCVLIIIISKDIVDEKGVTQFGCRFIKHPTKYKLFVLFYSSLHFLVFFRNKSQH